MTAIRLMRQSWNGLNRTLGKGLKMTRASGRNIGESCFPLSWSLENPLVPSLVKSISIISFMSICMYPNVTLRGSQGYILQPLPLFHRLDPHSNHSLPSWCKRPRHFWKSGCTSSCIPDQKRGVKLLEEWYCKYHQMCVRV